MHSHAAEAEAALVTSLRAGDEGGFVQVVDLQAPRRHASHATTSGHQIAEGPPTGRPLTQRNRLFPGSVTSVHRAVCELS